MVKTTKIDRLFFIQVSLRKFKHRRFIKIQTMRRELAFLMASSFISDFIVLIFIYILLVSQFLDYLHNFFAIVNV